MPNSRLIDARGLKCPLPVLKLEKALESMSPGAELTLIADDPVARIDIALYCRQHGHACVLTQSDGTTTFAIVTGGA